MYDTSSQLVERLREWCEENDEEGRRTTTTTTRPRREEEEATEEDDGVTSDAGTALLADRSKPVLVLLNPASGSGRARKVFSRSLEPVLREAGLAYRLVVTERRNHGRDLIASEQ